MFNRAKFLIAHGADPVAWARRYDLLPFSHLCGDCGVELETTLPFVAGDLRGLIAPECACGAKNPPYCVVRTGGDGSLGSLIEAGQRLER